MESVKESPAEAKAQPAQETKPAEIKQKVRGLVNMRCNDGSRLSPGKIVEISRKEYLRLKADPRFKKTPFFQDVASVLAKK